jgi:hypothetical protein
VDSGSGSRYASTNIHALIDERRTLQELATGESPWGRNDAEDRRADDERRSHIYAQIEEIDWELEFREGRG